MLEHGLLEISIRIIEPYTYRLIQVREILPCGINLAPSNLRATVDYFSALLLAWQKRSLERQHFSTLSVQSAGVSGEVVVSVNQLGFIRNYSAQESLYGLM